MNGDDTSGCNHDKGYRIRCMRSLLKQMKEDYTHFRRLWERIEKGSTDRLEIEELIKVLSWIKQGLHSFEELRKKGIEGVFDGEIRKINNDINNKEMSIRLLIYSISIETKNIIDGEGTFIPAPASNEPGARNG